MSMIATLILPTRDSHGVEHWHLIRDVESKLLFHFDGFTQHGAKGTYIMADGQPKMEPVTVFTIACADISSTVDVLRGIARAFGADAGQESVFLSLVHGASAEFVK